MGIKPFFLMPMSYANVELKRSRSEILANIQRESPIYQPIFNRFLYTNTSDLGEHNDVEIERS